MWRLLVPLNYLRISHPEKIKFDLVFPLVFACLFFSPMLSAQFRADAMALDVVGRSGDLLSILTGFFIAALAAVATFGSDEMNQPMPGSSPMVLTHRHQPPERLSRRRFLCYLFGYLAFMSLSLYFAGYLFYGIQRYVVLQYLTDYRIYTFATFWLIYGFVVGNLISNTLLGLFYLTDRMHRPNSVLSWKSAPEAKGPEADHRVAVKEDV